MAELAQADADESAWLPSYRRPESAIRSPDDPVI
jgi:hypothetical protein